MNRFISVLNFKGGTGKSTLAVNLAYVLALDGWRVLLFDCDIQGNAGGILPEKQRPTLTNVLKGEATLAHAIFEARPNFFVVPSDRGLNSAASYIVSRGRRAYGTLSKAVRDLSGFDIILFDHSPSYSTVTEAALLASDELLIPCELAPYPIEGLLEMFNKLAEELDDHQLSITGIVPFNVDFRYTISQQYLDELHVTFKEKVTRAVRTDALIPKAQAYHQTIFEYEAAERIKSKAAEDIRTLSYDLFGRRSTHAEA